MSRSIQIPPHYFEVCQADFLGGQMIDPQKHNADLLKGLSASQFALLRTNTEVFDGLHLLGMTYAAQKSFDLASDLLHAALLIQPENVEAMGNMAYILGELGRHEDAAVAYRHALSLNPARLDLILEFGALLIRMNDQDAALTCYQEGLGHFPESPEVLFNLGTCLQQRRQLSAAQDALQLAISLNPNFAQAYNNLGIVFSLQKQHAKARDCFQQALLVNGEYAGAYFNLAASARELQDYPEALCSLRRTLDLQPDYPAGLSMLAFSEQQICQWESLPRYREQLLNEDVIVSPFHAIAMGLPAAQQLHCARRYMQHKIPTLPPHIFQKILPCVKGCKLRLAYLSSDFHEHATAYLMAELFELHERSQFEVVAISYGISDGSVMHERLVAGFDQFHDVCWKSDFEIASLIHALEVDIVIDLKGHTQDARPGILAFKPAPLQIAYLGYPGSSGMPFIDYIVGDAWVTPFDEQKNFIEKIIQLPNSYQINDRNRHIDVYIPSKKECNLPYDGLVFCCFNNSYKITAEVFAVWMRLLNGVKGSVLWLLSDNVYAQNNLCAAAHAAGVDVNRLIFAQRKPSGAHLARQVHVDLFLDTFPVNAHTTASDALWMGVPLITCTGKSFAARVATSLLHAADFPEGVTSSLEEYESRALEWANTPGLLKNFRERLKLSRKTCSLFDSLRTCRALEAAYLRAWQRFEAGLSTEGFSIESKEV